MKIEDGMRAFSFTMEQKNFAFISLLNDKGDIKTNN